MRRLARFGDRARYAGILAVASLLLLLSAIAGDFFVLVIAAVLIGAPIVNWRAFLRLRTKRRDRVDLGLPPIFSLRTAYYAALFLAVAATSLAGVGIFVVLRELAAVEPMPRPILLVLLAFPLVLISGPAIEWLILVDELEEETRRLRRRLSELGVADPDAVAERVAEA